MVGGGINNKERITWLSLLIVSVVISVCIIVKYQTTLTLVNQKVADFEGERAVWTERKEDLTSQNSDLLAQNKNSTVPISNPDVINPLKQQGFNGSLEDIINDLMEHNELIPYDGVLGGTMGFYDRDNIYVLSDKWVFAYFDDGHINGYMLLSYSINNGTISWKVIDSYLFGQ